MAPLVAILGLKKRLLTLLIMKMEAVCSFEAMVWYLPIRLHGIIFHKIVILLIFTTQQTLDFNS
jgi:hypothetical protein